MIREDGKKGEITPDSVTVDSANTNTKPIKPLKVEDL